MMWFWRWELGMIAERGMKDIGRDGGEDEMIRLCFAAI